jgi:hypothetical protein
MAGSISAQIIRLSRDSWREWRDLSNQAAWMMKMKLLKVMTMYFKGVPIPLVLSEMPSPGPSWHGVFIRRRPGA